MLNLRYILLLFFVFFGCRGLSGEKCWAQDPKTIDSLKHALKNARHDSVRCQIIIELKLETENEELVALNNTLKEISLKNLSKTVPKSKIHNRFKSFYASYLYTEADIKFREGHTEEALIAFKNILTYLEGVNDPEFESKVICNIGFIYERLGDIKKARECFLKSLYIEKKLKNLEGQSSALMNLGGNYHITGNNDSAMFFFRTAKTLSEMTGNKESVLNALNNMAVIEYNSGHFKDALSHFFQSLKMAEELGQQEQVANSLVSIGSVLEDQGDFDLAFQNYNKALKINKQLNNKNGLAYVLNSIGIYYEKKNDLPNALKIYEEAYKIEVEIGDKSGAALLLNNMGVIWFKTEELNKALDYYTQSLKMREEINDKIGIGYSNFNIGFIYYKQKKLKQALMYNNICMEIANEIKYPELVRKAAKMNSNIYRQIGKYDLALENYELFIKMRDSINNESTRKASIKQQLKYEYEKQAAADSVAHAKESEIKNAEIAKQTAEIKAKKNQQYALFGGLGLVMVFAGFMYNRFKVTQKQKGIIEEQKEVVEEQKKLVEEKQKEILDSIQYARRIQMAQIPSEKRVNVLLKKLRNHEGK